MTDIEKEYGKVELNPFWAWLGGKAPLKLTLVSSKAVIVEPDNLFFDANQVMPVAFKELATGLYFNWSFVAAFEPKG